MKAGYKFFNTFGNLIVIYEIREEFCYYSVDGEKATSPLPKKYIECMIDANKYFIADTIGSLLYG